MKKSFTTRRLLKNSFRCYYPNLYSLTFFIKTAIEFKKQQTITKTARKKYIVYMSVHSHKKSSHPLQKKLYHTLITQSAPKLRTTELHSHTFFQIIILIKKLMQKTCIYLLCSEKLAWGCITLFLLRLTIVMRYQ